MSAGLAAGCAPGGRACAATWDFNPRLELGGLYNDNYRLAPDPPDKVHASGPLADALMNIHMLDPRADLSIVPRIHATYFPDDHEDQSTDGYLEVNGSYRTQKAVFGGAAQYANETVITSELLSATFPGVGLGQVVGAESGRVSVPNRRELERVAPTFTYDFAPRRHLQLDGEYLNVSFSKNDVFQQIGFHSFTGMAGVAFDVTQRSTFTVRGLGNRYEPDESGGNTNRYGLEALWTFRPSNIMQTYVRLGVQHTQADTTSDGEVQRTVAVGGAGVSWTYQITEYVIDALRDLSPSAAGAILEHDEVRFRVLHTIRPRLSLVAGARAIRLRGGSEPALTVQGSDYVAASAGLRYQLTRNYRISGNYDYTWQRFQGEPKASSNAVTVSLIWQPLSRFEPLPNLYGIPTDRP